MSIHDNYEVTNTFKNTDKSKIDIAVNQKISNTIKRENTKLFAGGGEKDEQGGNLLQAVR